MRWHFLVDYPNLLAGGDADRVAKSYGRNAERLIKTQAALRSRQRLLLRHSAASQSKHKPTYLARPWRQGGERPAEAHPALGG
jgi:hypothetical protein